MRRPDQAEPSLSGGVWRFGSTAPLVAFVVKHQCYDLEQVAQGKEESYMGEFKETEDEK